MHPDITYIVCQANSDAVTLGLGEVFYEAVDLLDEVAGQYSHETKEWHRGWDEIRDRVLYEAPINPDYFARAEDLPSNLDFDPAGLLAALDGVVEQGRVYGRRDVVVAAREQRNTETWPNPTDYYDETAEDFDPEDDSGVDDYKDQLNYLTGLQAAVDVLTERYGDPDPSWEPA